MDETEQFIKMADCPEVQKQWKIDKYDLAIKRGVHHVLIATNRIRNKAWYIWLPRQDDIQKMLPINKCKCPGCLIIHLYKFLEKNIEGLADVHVDSMEQLWLAFYMHEKYSKIWSSKEEKWVKK